MKLYFLSLASGSSGNCYYLGTDEYGILIDAGIGARTIRKRLREKGIGLEKIRGVFVTHDHCDHIKGCGCLGEKFHIPIYSTEEVHHGLDRNSRFTEKLFTSRRILYKEVPVKIGEFTIRAFEVSHDGSDNMGYFVEAGDKCFSFATDLGYISETVAGYLCRSNYMVLEANYDHEMLINGTYPDSLKERILGKNGHLCNDETAGFLASNYLESMRHVFLCHLSRDNNHPDVALQTVQQALEEQGIQVGIDIIIEPLHRTENTGMYVFE